MKENNIFYFQNKSQEVVLDLKDFPSNLRSDQNVLKTSNLWKLETGERILFAFSLLSNKIVMAKEEIQPLMQRYEELTKKQTEIRSLLDLKLLKNSKLIGMTITGAGIHSKLIQQLKPEIVIVEEAAEVLEPLLIAALPRSVKRLILIGDHKQLRPQVDTYELRRKFNFDISLMERLINNNFPYSALETQSRMRPEFSKLLKDIYPNLKDNLEVVGQNKTLNCLPNSMFFWTHANEEKKDRSTTNPGEKDMVVSLTRYLLSNNVNPSEITILAAYQGKTLNFKNKIKIKY